jgi:HD-GYP domain-containing protein (c-di-GMP phosphodiesterase class II)
LLCFKGRSRRGAGKVKKRVPVESLQFGMYVSELDRPWTETPFVFQGFLLNSQAQLDTLRKHCRAVYIDPEQGLDWGRSAPVRLTPAGPAFRLRGGAGPRPPASSTESEFPKACAVHAAHLSLVNDTLRAASIQAEIDGRALRESVATMIESVLRAPDALALVARLGMKAPRLATRAVNSAIYMIAFGRFLEHAREEIELMGLVGLLQDVGKLRLPKALLDKRGPLSARETELARAHVSHTTEILRACRGLPPRVAELVELHHERQDGSGYPRGLRGAEIGLIGSMAAIVDAFDAMTSARPFPTPLPVTQAYGVLHKQRESHFHAGLVEEFCRCFGVFPVGCPVELNSGEAAIVVGQHPAMRLKPRVMVVLDAEGNPLRPHKLLDLSRNPRASLEETYHVRRTLEYGSVGVDAAEFLPG